MSDAGEIIQVALKRCILAQAMTMQIIPQSRNFLMKFLPMPNIAHG